MAYLRCERAPNPTYFGAGTSWQHGSCRIDIVTGIFPSERIALEQAAAYRALRAIDGHLSIERADGPDVPVEGDACLAYDVEIFDASRSWADATLSWDDAMAAVASGRDFACVLRAARPVAPDIPPVPTAENAVTARPTPPSQCGQMAN